jgi:hypothetical protein
MGLCGPISRHLNRGWREKEIDRANATREVAREREKGGRLRRVWRGERVVRRESFVASVGHILRESYGVLRVKRGGRGGGWGGRGAFLASMACCRTR